MAAFLLIPFYLLPGLLAVLVLKPPERAST
jgi:hypothetical protein